MAKSDMKSCAGTLGKGVASVYIPGVGGWFWLAMGVNFAAIGSSSWIARGDSDTGLINERNPVDPSKYPLQNPEHIACLVFNILGDVLLIIAVFGYQFSGMTRLPAGIMGLVAAIFIMIAQAVFTGVNIGEVEPSGVNWGWGFALAWLSFCFALIEAALMLFWTNAEEKHPGSFKKCSSGSDPV